MNSYLGTRLTPWTPGYRQFVPVQSIVDPAPAGCLLFVDEREDSLNDPCFLIDMNSFDPDRPTQRVMVDFPTDRHEGGATMSFVDGHVETWRWLDARTRPPLRVGVGLPLNLASPNNPDVARIQAAASRRSTPARQDNRTEALLRTRCNWRSRRLSEKRNPSSVMTSICEIRSWSAGVAVMLLAAGLRAEPVRPVSVGIQGLPGRPSTTGNGPSGGARFSRDGRFVVFTSAASDLVTRDVNGSRMDVYLRDLATDRMELISATPGERRRRSAAPSISADGRRVAFVSRASDLVAGDTNGLPDVFVRDRVEGTTRRISVASDGTAADGECFAPVLTPDGRWVCFGSRAANLLVGTPDDDGRVDVFVHDLQTGETQEGRPRSPGPERSRTWRSTR